MNNRRNITAKLLATALAALSYCTAHAQMTTTNTLPTTYVYPLSAADTNAPGFIWNVSQVAAANPGTIAFAEAQLAGDEGTNNADPSQAYSVAAGPATVSSNVLLPITFSIPGVINMTEGTGTGGRLDLPGEDQGIVGTPGTGLNSLQNISAEALTYLYLPQGPITMGVRSDDGFQVQIGAANPGDRYSTNGDVVEFYNGGRGAADSIVTFNVAQAGLYAARLLYFQGSGDASVEWYSFPAAGTTNATLGAVNTGTNAVLINDVADSGIPAYQDITAADKGSYISFLNPGPGATGLPLFPTITATFVNGTVAVKDIAFSVDGTSFEPAVTTTTNGATATYTITNVLANISPHNLTISWNDNGATMEINSTFSSLGYITLNPAQIVTPDTNKPGFKFNIFANAGDTLNASANGVQGGESDFLDNTELGLNGLLPDGGGGILPNMVTLANNGVATGAAPALGGPNAPAEFVVTNAISLNAGNEPGFPAQDGSADISHSEILTYVVLPKGFTTFNLNVDGYYRAYMGSWDYTSALQVGSTYLPLSGPTSFSVYAPEAGCYPLRLTLLNLSGTPTEALSATALGSTNTALVGDVANGGYATYRALTTPSKPYIRYASPRPVPRQMLYPNNRVLIRVQDSDNTFTDSTATFTLDGNPATITKNRVGDVLEMTWNATTLQTPAEIHTGLLAGKDSAGNSISEQWSFQNLKAVYLPTAQDGYYIPTNAVVIEDFSEYADPTAFTNGSPTTQMVVGAPAGLWYKSPQPENPLVDVAPIWTNVPAGPTNWFVWNWDILETELNVNNVPEDTIFDSGDGKSIAYNNFLCVDVNTFSGLEPSVIGGTAPGEMINGTPLAALFVNNGQNCLIAESDNRQGGNPGQTQFAMSKQFNLSGVTNPVLAFTSLKKQNQDDLGAIEYSVDGGATWAPVIYYLDGHSLGDTSLGEDLQINTDNTVNVINTLFHDTDPGEIPNWSDSTGDQNSTYGAGLAAPISTALSPFFAPRINDDNFSGLRVEVVRLPLAAHQSNVRLRIVQLGTCSWYFGIANIAFYDVPPSPGSVVPTGLAAPVTTGGSTLTVTTSGGNINVSWTGSGTLQSASVITGSSSDWSNVTPAPTGNTYTAPIGTGDRFFRVVN
ncbi:MAG TPA: hypothetical protein VGO67_04880 [Verrucomicrobiae bacterium]|jgi:hypothetical protein